MKILAIETSCDETAISILDCSGGVKKPVFKILGNAVASQAKLHEQYGGVFPMMAKREHSKNIVPLFLGVLREAKMLEKNKKVETFDITLKNMLEREPEMSEQFLKEIPKIKAPKFDAIAVTQGPGLEPALWVGLNFAKALATVWNLPIIPVNHMEGHVLSILIQESKGKSKKIFAAPKVKFPAISLLVSGGHTELVVVKDWMKYKKIGQTRDDAAGEAFDKVARMLELPYPGGPEISKLAEKETSEEVTLPRPMIHSKDFDFSFSGLKTSVLYFLRDLKAKPSDTMKIAIAKEFETAVIDVLTSKTLRALKKYRAKTLIVGGGVAANKALRNRLAQEMKKEKIELYFPTRELSTDNSLMIGIAGYFRGQKKLNKKVPRGLRAQGNLELS